LNPNLAVKEILSAWASPRDLSLGNVPGETETIRFYWCYTSDGEVDMGMQTWRLKGIPRKALKSRLANKRARGYWHFGPKNVLTKQADEPVDVLVKKLRIR
jgi:hypothetical protein